MMASKKRTKPVKKVSLSTLLLLLHLLVSHFILTDAMVGAGGGSPLKI